jgi:hypothetical protein
MRVHLEKARTICNRNDVLLPVHLFSMRKIEMTSDADEIEQSFWIERSTIHRPLAKIRSLPIVAAIFSALVYLSPGTSYPFDLTPADIEATSDPVYISLVAATMASDYRYFQLGSKYFSALGFGYSTGTVSIQPLSVTYGLGFDDNFNMGFPKKKFYHNGLLFEIDDDQLGKAAPYISFQGIVSVTLSSDLQFAPSLQLAKMDAQLSLCSRSIYSAERLFSACFTTSKIYQDGGIRSANSLELTNHSLLRVGKYVAKVALAANLNGSEFQWSKPENLSVSLEISGIVPLGRERSIGMAFNLGFPAKSTHGTKHALSVPIKFSALGGDFQIEPSIVHAIGGYFAGDPLEDWTASVKISSKALRKADIHVNFGLTKSSADVYSDKFIEIGISINL